MNYLYPLSKNEFFALHKKAWENGWAYGPGFDELYLDYLVNWVYFVDYLDILVQSKNNKHNRLYTRQSGDIVTIPFKSGEVLYIHVPDFHSNYSEPESVYDTIKILIGEAPPFWVGNSKDDVRTYFYNPKHVNPKQNWLTIPHQYYMKRPSASDIKDKNDKVFRLRELAQNGVILLDVFPFPVWQDTDVRRNVTDSFSNHVKSYFLPHVLSVIDYVKDYDASQEIQYGIMAPEYTSLQLMYGTNSSKILRQLNPKPIEIEKISLAKISDLGDLPESDKSKFLFRIIKDKDCPKTYKSFNAITNELEYLPILINGQSPTFKDFFNSSEEKLKEKFGIKTK